MADVLVAMSGGVDSSVAAALLADAGHRVVGVTLKLWGGESDSGCCSVSDVDDARRVAQQLGIDHHVFNFGDDFETHVIAPYVESWDRGETPNPCIECNRHIKFDRLLRRADALGFDQLATGHHARIVELADGQRRIARGADPAKDQSYVLHMLDRDQLDRLVLPVGALTKDRVRAVAAELGLRTARKPDSQDVCFIHSSGGRRRFLGDRIELTPARIVDTDGAVVGQTDAVQLVTIGQRKGLDLGGSPHRRFVVDIDRSAATVTVGPIEQTMTTAMTVTDVRWVGDAITTPLDVQTSAHGEPVAATVVAAPDDGSVVVVRFASPQRRVAVGQSVGFYAGDLVVGGGVVGRLTPDDDRG